MNEHEKRLYKGLRVMTQRARLWLNVVKKSALAVLPCLAAVASADDAAWHDLTDIRETARQFALAQIVDRSVRTDVQASEVDPRLRLRRCATSLAAYLPPGAQLRDNGVVGVRCAGPVPWKLFVPVRLVRIASVARIVGHHGAGHRLVAADVDWTEQELRSIETSFIRGRGDPVGQVLRHAVADGQMLRPAMLRAAHVIARGDHVTLAVSGSALAIRMRGQALEDGAVGQRVRARNRSSGRVVEGIVRDEGLIEISVY
jgi:flagella basal body P-ring formation protein FlgA